MVYVGMITIVAAPTIIVGWSYIRVNIISAYHGVPVNVYFMTAVDIYINCIAADIGVVTVTRVATVAVVAVVITAIVCSVANVIVVIASV